jgi:predicted aminopeptidase
MSSSAGGRWFLSAARKWMVKAAISGVWLSTGGCMAGYVLRSASFQVKMLHGAKPIESVLQDSRLTPEERERLAQVERIKDFGGTVGLARGRSYETMNPDWHRTITNFSACDAAAFEPVTWWFPVVGRVPYLGFFREADVHRAEERYRRLGYDVYSRPVGAYSTLGWFRDPVLPSMLDWSEGQLAETILHELAHATLWIPGSAEFNETFANVLGDEAALQYMVAAHGPDSPEVLDWRNEVEDGVTYTAMLQDLYQELNETYKNPNVDRETRIRKKEELFGKLAEDVATRPFHQAARYLEAVRRGPWNNARIYQYHAYNQHRELFEALLCACGRDIPTFVARMKSIAAERKDPAASLMRAVHEEPPREFRK